MISKQVGFIGLGMMGKPMAHNLVKAGFVLTVYDIIGASVEELVAVGAKRASSPAKVAEQSDIIITMLPTSSVVEEVVTGSLGVLEGLKAGAILIDMSTIDPNTTMKVGAAIHSKGGRMLDAPVSRGEPAAVTGTLSIMVGGEAEVLEECQPILKALGTDIFHCGSLGTGEVVKLVNNLMVGIFVPAISEALVFGLKSGAKLETILKVIRASSANNWLLDNVFQNKVFQGKFEPGFSINLMHKDLGLAIAAADRLAIPLPLAALSRQLYGVARSLGKGGKDYTAIITPLEEVTGVKARL